MYIFKALSFDSANQLEYSFQDLAASILRGIIHLHNHIIFYLIIILYLVCMLLFHSYSLN